MDHSAVAQPASAAAAAPMLDEAGAGRLYSKVAWRLLPFLFICYIAAFIDRVNVNHASMSMKRDLGLSDDVYGFGAGIFFVSYFLFEVPSNLIMQRVGPRRWIARIMITWGLISMAMAFAQGPTSFYVLRFLLGVAEAGFFPGMILYLSYWFPVRRRAQVIARFMTAIAVSNVIGAPLSYSIMGMDGAAGLPGWKWLFLIEGVPSLVLGGMVLAWLVDRPAEARFLAPGEAAWLERELEADRSRVAAAGRHDLRAAFTEPRVWWLAAIYFCNAFANYGLGLWLAPLIKGSGTFTERQAILLCGIPYAVAAVAMVVNGWSSDRFGERRWHVALPHVVAGCGMLGAVLGEGSPALVIAGLATAAAGICSALGPFWTLPAGFLTGAAAAGGIAVINSLGNLGGFAGSYAMGALKTTDSAHAFRVPLSVAAASLLLGAVLTAFFPARRDAPG
jgi:sugar phosphate permease